MAKRYFSFSDLQGVKGEYKPYSTLGHHCVVTPQGERIVVVGSACGRVTLKPGDTLGYDLGTVWLVPHPDSYRDPIRRALALAKVSQRVLEYSFEPVEYTQSWGRRLPNSAADVSNGDLPPRILGGHMDTEVAHWDRENEDQYLGPFSHTRRVTGGEAIVVRTITNRAEVTTSRSSRVSRVVVRPSANRRKVADWLEELWDVGQAHERRVAKEATERAALEANLDVVGGAPGHRPTARPL